LRVISAIMIFGRHADFEVIVFSCILLQYLIQQFPRVPHELRAYGPEQVAFSHFSDAFGRAHVHTEQFPAEERSVPIPENVHELLRQGIGPLPAVVVILLDLRVVQPDDHEAARHRAAGPAGTRHTCPERPRDPQCRLAVQTEPPAVSGQDSLRSGKAVEKRGKGLFDVIILFVHWKSKKGKIKGISRRGAEDTEKI
jgi:hypothetical protein